MFYLSICYFFYLFSLMKQTYRMHLCIILDRRTWRLQNVATWWWKVSLTRPSRRRSVCLESLATFSTWSFWLARDFSAPWTAWKSLSTSRKRLQCSMDRMEKSAHVGLVALAVSDMMFCVFYFCTLVVPLKVVSNKLYSYFPLELIEVGYIFITTQ